MAILVIVVAALMIAGIVLPALGVIPRNRLIGVRTTATLASDEAWRRGHRAAVLPTCLSSGAAIIAGVVGVGLGQAQRPVLLAVLAVLLLGGALWSLAAASRALSHHDAESPPADAND